MDTTSPNDSLSAALFGKTRRAVLSLLYSHADEAFYLRQLARAAGVGLGAVQREVKRLSEAGILQRTGRGQLVYYQANPQRPLFAELRSLVVKTSGVGDVLRSALTPLSSRVRVAFIYGSVARGAERRDSDVDVMVVGDVTFGEVVSALRPAQETLGREINPTVYPPGEFRSKLRANHHFLKSVVRGTRLFLIGDECELASVAGKRLAG
jgi:predicted nucleotidyltransferase